MSGSSVLDRGACTDTQTAAGPTARAFPLPDDVLVCALELLCLSDLWSAARVSRRFYAAAWRSGLYIHRSHVSIFDSAHPRFISRKVACWNELVDHALQKNLRFGFTLSLADCSPLRQLLGPITKSLPILVFLSVSVDGRAYPDLCAALQEPAPYLRNLDLCTCSSGDAPLGPVLPSCGLFSGNAPMLRELGLECRSLGPEPIPAFANVIRFSTSFPGKDQHISLQPHFPKLLHLLFWSNDRAPEVAPPQLDLCGLALRSLAFQGTALQQFAPLSRWTQAVPNLYHCLIQKPTETIWNDPPVWPGCYESDGCAIGMRIDETKCLYASTGGTWRRSYFHPSTPYGLPGLSAQLSYLRIDYTVLRRLLNCGVHLVALRRLRIDILPQSPEPGSVWRTRGDPLTVHLLATRPRSYIQQVRYPALALVAILWHARAPEGPVTLDRESVVLLGRALATDSKPVLELGDVDRERALVLSGDPPKYSSADIGTLFSSVRRVPCAFGVPLDRFDGDAWNDNVAFKEEIDLNPSLVWY